MFTMPRASLRWRFCITKKRESLYLLLVSHMGALECLSE